MKHSQTWSSILHPVRLQHQGCPIHPMLPVAMEPRPRDSLISTASLQYPAENSGRGRVGPKVILRPGSAPLYFLQVLGAQTPPPHLKEMRPVKSNGKASMHRMTCHRLLSTQSWPHHTLVRKACGQGGLRAVGTQQPDPHPSSQPPKDEC